VSCFLTHGVVSWWLSVAAATWVLEGCVYITVSSLLKRIWSDELSNDGAPATHGNIRLTSSTSVRICAHFTGFWVLGTLMTIIWQIRKEYIQYRRRHLSSKCSHEKHRWSQWLDISWHRDAHGSFNRIRQVAPMYARLIHGSLGARESAC